MQHYESDYFRRHAQEAAQATIYPKIMVHSEWWRSINSQLKQH